MEYSKISPNLPLMLKLVRFLQIYKHILNLESDRWMDAALNSGEDTKANAGQMMKLTSNVLYACMYAYEKSRGSTLTYAFTPNVHIHLPNLLTIWLISQTHEHLLTVFYIFGISISLNKQLTIATTINDKCMQTKVNEDTQNVLRQTKTKTKKKSLSDSTSLGEDRKK